MNWYRAPFPEDEDEKLPPGPKGESIAERLARLARELHGVTDPASSKPTVQELAHRARTEAPAEQRLDAILCPTCARGGPGPSHEGSAHCESGSIASGGHRAHCSCSWCF